MSTEVEQETESWKVLLSGISDALNFRKIYATFRSSGKIRKKVKESLLLNVVIFAGSILFYHQAMLPTVSFLIGSALGDIEDGGKLGSFIETSMTAVYYLFWVWPLYALSLLLNGFWYQDIAKEAVLYKLQLAGADTRRIKPSGQNFIDVLAGECYRLLLGFVYLAQTALLSGLPLIGRFIGIALVAWLYALYSFEYVWASAGWPVQRRLSYFARHYLYFLGYGLPFAITLFFFPELVRDGVFAALFPLFIINAVFSSRPRPLRTENSILPKSFQPFRWSYTYTSVLIRYAIKPLYRVISILARAFRKKPKSTLALAH